MPTEHDEGHYVLVAQLKHASGEPLEDWERDLLVLPEGES